MRIVIAGAGKVGRFIANDLRDAGHDVLLIDKDASLQKRTVSAGVEWCIADACEVASLTDAALDRADVVVAATGDDQVNLVFSLLAKQEFGVPRVIARVNHPKNEWLFNENWGIDTAVSTPHLVTALVEEAMSLGNLVRLLSFGGGSAQLVEITLTADSPAVDRSIIDLAIPRDATVVAILRSRHVVIPRGDTVFEVGDEVVALVTDSSEEAMRDTFAAR